MSMHKSLVRGACILPAHPGPPRAWGIPRLRGGGRSVAPSSLRGAHWAPVAPAKDGPFFRSLLLSGCSASARELGCQEPDQVPSCPPLHPLVLAWPRPTHPLTGSQVPLVEVLQLVRTLPLSLLSRNLLHAGRHGVGSTWGVHGLSGGTTADPREDHNAHTPQEPSQEGAEPPRAHPTHHLCPHEPSCRHWGELSPDPITFLEGLRVQGAEGVQALPGVWGLLSTENKQIQGEWGTHTFPQGQHPGQ